MDWMLRRGQDDIILILSRNFRSNHAGTIHTTTKIAIQQKYNSGGTTTPALD